MFYMWYNERNNYDFKNGLSNAYTGHFTQVIWKETTKIGCAVKCNGNRCYGSCLIRCLFRYLYEYCVTDNYVKVVLLYGFE